KSGIFIRRQGGQDRYYARIGGRRIALCTAGARWATTDPAMADVLYGQLVEQARKRELRGVLELPEPTTLAQAAADYLVTRAEEGRRGVGHLGGDREVSSVTVADCKSYAAALRRRGLSGGSVRHHLNSLGCLYRLMGEQQRVAPGYNPISLWRKKPTAQRREA